MSVMSSCSDLRGAGEAKCIIGLLVHKGGLKGDEKGAFGCHVVQRCVLCRAREAIRTTTKDKEKNQISTYQQWHVTAGAPTWKSVSVPFHAQPRRTPHIETNMVGTILAR